MTRSSHRLGCEPLESRDCPAPLFPAQPANPPITPPMPVIHVNGVSDGTKSRPQDLIVINDVRLGVFEVRHHTGSFMLQDGIVVPVSEVIEVVSYYNYTNGLRLVINAGLDKDYVINNTSIPCTITGGDGNDYLIGGGGADTIYGDAGHDTIGGQGGNDTLRGGDDEDILHGGTGADLLFGESGVDFLYAGGDQDVDRLRGGSDTDWFYRDWDHVMADLYSTLDILEDLTLNDVDVQP